MMAVFCRPRVSKAADEHRGAEEGCHLANEFRTHESASRDHRTQKMPSNHSVMKARRSGHFQAERCSEFVPYPIWRMFHYCYNGCWIKEYCTAADVQQMAKSVQFTAFKLRVNVDGASDLA